MDWLPGDSTVSGYWTDDPQGVDDTPQAEVEYAAVRTSY